MDCVTGTFDSKTGMCILDNSADQYLVVHPDTLVSGTTVSMATKCLRQSILNERFRTEDQNEAMLIGTLLHDLFDLAMEFHGELIPEQKLMPGMCQASCTSLLYTSLYTSTLSVVFVICLLNSGLEKNLQFKWAISQGFNYYYCYF